MTDPWMAAENEKITEDSEIDKDTLNFEDNFSSGEIKTTASSSNKVIEPLPDSSTYLQGLERKLKNLKKNTKLVDALAEKREDCMRSLLDSRLDTIENNNDTLLELDAAINKDSAVYEICRHIQPIQPMTLGETVEFVKFDQLAEKEDGAQESSEKQDPASAEAVDK